ncbi:unnamed protein product [Agarophyton chilense]
MPTSLRHPFASKRPSRSRALLQNLDLKAQHAKDASSLILNQFVPSSLRYVMQYRSHVAFGTTAELAEVRAIENKPPPIMIRSGRALVKQIASRPFTSVAAEETAIVAVGSNVGNRVSTIHAALRALQTFSCTVHATSFLYESKPMYVTDQPAFLNGAVEISTPLPPLQLLHELKRIEYELGRSFGSMRNGPRPIDLDIICYGERRVQDGHTLQIPHPRLHEREFVLRPVCDISESIPIPFQHRTRTAKQLLEELLPEGKSELKKVTPTHMGKLLSWGERTLLMGVINATPDSFSDGGEHNSVDTALQQVDRFCQQGFDVVDVGGQSTRPGAELIEAEQELDRILPIIDAIRRSFPNVVISCDTFLSNVAEKVLDAGAEVINDISAGTLDEKMHETLARRDAACVLMHTRGTPATMRNQQHYGDVTTDVAAELLHNVRNAQTKGVKRWSVITDPGIGFAKNKQLSQQLLRETARFCKLCGEYPVLLGASRKSWLADIPLTDTKRARDWVTAGAIASCIARGGVDMVRVHEAGVADAVRAADTIVRGL